RLAAESARRRADQAVLGHGFCNVGYWVDVEGANNAGVQALEVEDTDVRMQAGDRLQHMAALLGGVHSRVVRTYARRDNARPFQLGEIKEVERSDARRHPVRRHAGKLAAGEGERHEIQLLDDLVCEARVRARVKRKRLEVVL